MSKGKGEITDQRKLPLYDDTMRRREGFRRLFDLVRLSRVKYQTKVYLEGTLNLEEALNKPEITFLMEVTGEKREAPLELFEMMRLSVRRGHPNPRCVVSLMVVGKVENLAHLSLDYLVDFVGNKLAVVVFEESELFMNRMRMRHAKKGVIDPTPVSGLRKEDGSPFPVAWPVEKRLWDLRVRENYLEEYALNNFSIDKDDADDADDQSTSGNAEDQLNNREISLPGTSADAEHRPERKTVNTLQEEWSDVYGYSRWVPVQDLLSLYDAQMSGMFFTTASSPSQLPLPVPRISLRNMAMRNSHAVGQKAVLPPATKEAVSSEKDESSCPWCPLAVGGRCHQHSTIE